MNRRHFLSTLAAGLTGLTLDPERLLWVPGAKTFFLRRWRRRQTITFTSSSALTLTLPFPQVGQLFTIYHNTDVSKIVTVRSWDGNTIFVDYATFANSGQKMALCHRLETQAIHAIEARL